MIEDYSKHAYVWDWDGYDSTPEYEYWYQCAKEYGEKVLIPMCALGSVGVYMVERGVTVTAFDLTKEMIFEGKKRFGAVGNLELVVADICDFDFPDKSYDFAFIKDQDLHLLQSIDEVKRAFKCLYGHMRKGGCLALELTLPMKESFSTPKQIFHPRKPNYTDKKVWKESECRYDAVEKRNYIKQMVYVQEGRKLTQFEYSVCLQYFDRDEVLSALAECGFEVIGEYSDRKKTTWTGEEGFWHVEAVRK